MSKFAYLACISLSCLLLGTQVLAQNNFAPPPVAPDHADDDSQQVSPDDQSMLLPTTPAVLPPTLPDRPAIERALPFSPPAATDANSLMLSQFEKRPVKVPLTWRAKALKLNAGEAGAANCTVNCAFDDAIMALVGALPSQGLRVEVLNSKAGELLAAPTDEQARQRFVFTLSETEPGTVLIKGSPMWSNKKGNDTIQSVLKAIAPDTKRRSAL